MSDGTWRYSQILRCGHCGNTAPMRVAVSHRETKRNKIEGADVSWDEHDDYQLLTCLSCKGVTLRRFREVPWRDEEAESEVILYPHAEKMPLGLPAPVTTAYQAANKVRSIDPNAYAVLLGRVLELVCQHRNAEGDTLYRKLEDLGNKGDIPRPLVEMAHELRQLRNVGAHASLGELTAKEIPFLDDLCRAILEYVYSAPELVQRARNRLSEITGGGAPV